MAQERNQGRTGEVDDGNDVEAGTDEQVGDGGRAGDRPVEQAGIVVGHRADDEPIITDRDPDPDREEPTTTASGDSAD